MTLIAALKWISEDGKEGVLMASDSKVTVGPVSYEARKIYPLFLEGVPIAVAAGAGDAAIIKQSYYTCDEILTDLAAKEWNGKTPTFEQFRKGVDEVEKALIKRFADLRSQGIDVDFSMILASADENGKASMYVFDSRGLAEPVHDNPGFAVTGIGFFTGADMLLKLLDYTPEKSYELDAGALATFIIDAVSEIDPAVGSFVDEIYYMGIMEEGLVLNTLSEEGLVEAKKRIGEKKDLIRRLWRLYDTLGGEKVYEKMRELETEGLEDTDAQ